MGKTKKDKFENNILKFGYASYIVGLWLFAEPKISFMAVIFIIVSVADRRYGTLWNPSSETQGQLVGVRETGTCGKKFGIEKLERLKGAPAERILSFFLCFRDSLTPTNRCPWVSEDVWNPTVTSLIQPLSLYRTKPHAGTYLFKNTFNTGWKEVERNA